MDKASILAGAIEYLKQLQQRIQVLEKEEEKEKRRKYEKSALVSYNQSVMNQSSLPEVKVRTCNGNVLMEIYCKKTPRILNHILCQIEKLHLCIISTSVIPFGNTTLHITITAQVYIYIYKYKCVKRIKNLPSYNLIMRLIYVAFCVCNQESDEFCTRAQDVANAIRGTILNQNFEKLVRM